MAGTVDALENTIRRLERIVSAQRSGIPPVVTILVYGRDCGSDAAIDRAILSRLKQYGLEDESEVETAGSTLRVVLLRFLDRANPLNIRKTVGDEGLVTLEPA